MMVDLRVPVNKGGAGEQRSERERGKTAVGDDVATKIGREETTAERAKIEVVCRGRAINLSFSFFPGNKIRIEWSLTDLLEKGCIQQGGHT